MDYEFRIKQAELELAHLREMQALRGGRLDAHDRSIEAMKEILDGILVTVNRTTANLDVLTIQIGKLEGLVEAFMRGQARNGGGSGQA